MAFACACLIEALQHLQLRLNFVDRLGRQDHRAIATIPGVIPRRELQLPTA